jgi:hypothetical protein
MINSENSNFDPYEDEIAAHAGAPINRDPFGNDYEVAKHSRHAEKSKGLSGYEGNIQKLGHEAMLTLDIAKLDRAPDYSDPDAPKRNREELRKDQ